MAYSLETGRCVTQHCSWLDGVCETIMPWNGLTKKKIHVIVNYFKPDHGKWKELMNPFPG